ncbi:MAG TPA: hypothetical protein VMV51_14855 [Gemmatimonadaceae bacterium]|nr:hypothetical protein [Gemmatimonadaceae bacterium]
MNSGQTFVFMMTGLICSTVVILAIAKAFIRRRSGPASPLSTAETAFTDRLERMERAIDTVALEVERVSEAQRFVARILSERRAAPAQPSIPERVNTPH